MQKRCAVFGIRWLRACLSLLAFACSSEEPLEESSTQDNDPPTLQVLSPQRGFSTESNLVNVRGAFSDASPTTVTINGTPIKTNGGEFSSDVSLARGVSFVEVVATDDRGNASRDTRAVVSGEFSDVGTMVKDAAVLRINPETLQVVQTAALDAFQNLVLTNYISTPVIDDGGVCGTKLDVHSFEYETVDATLSPTQGGIAFSFSLSKIRIGGKVKKCLTTDYILKISDATVSGVLAVELTKSYPAEFVVRTADISTNLGDVNADGSILVEIADLFLDFENKIKSALENALTETAPSKIAEVLNDAIREFSFSMAGQSFTIEVAPRRIDFDTTGGVLVADVAVSGPNIAGKRCLRQGIVNPTDVAASTNSALQFALSDELLNQALCVAWAGGLFSRTLIELPDDANGVLAALIGSIDTNATTAPFISANPDGGGWDITIGDLLLNVKAKNGSTVLASLALNLRTNLKALLSEDGHIVPQLQNPYLIFDVLAGTSVGTLGSDQLEVLSKGVGATINEAVAKTIGGYTLPSFKGISAQNAVISPKAGYLELSANLDF